jgi:hypothetical protein
MCGGYDYDLPGILAHVASQHSLVEAGSDLRPKQLCVCWMHRAPRRIHQGMGVPNFYLEIERAGGLAASDQGEQHTRCYG